VTGKKKPVKDKGTVAPLKILPALTEKQSQCLLFIFNYYGEHRHFPTHREIAKAMGSSSTTAAMYLQPLIEKGYLKRAGKGKTARNIRVTTDGLERLRMMGVSV
jgi:DNA-binding MarR family transcriptional regulator